MLTRTDTILFPEPHCVQIEPHRVVYPIFKNGSSSIENTPGGQYINGDGIQHLDTVEVYVREPFDRYVAGVQSYLAYNPDLDRTTALKLIKQHLFLDRHFLPQFHWLLNLRRWGNPWLKIRHINELSDATELTWNALVRDQELIDYFSNDPVLDFYLLLDKPLLETFMGRVIKFDRIVKHLQEFEPELYSTVIGQVKKVCSVLD